MESIRKIETFCETKSTIEREFHSREYWCDIKKAGWKNLFRELEVSLEFTGAELELHYDVECLDRNRYRTVLPYKQTRVKLSNTENDYINASFVTLEEPEVNRSYIVTQGPLENTIGHFWQMVWEQRSVGIVMLCKCVEEDMNKCAHYWPAVGEKPMVTGSYMVECISCDRNSSYCLSSLKLKNLDTEKSRTVLHYHYHAWPDFGVPKDPMAFLEFLMDVRRSGVMQPDVGPAVVHCSAGIGRSGVFSLVDVCVSWLEAGGLHTLDIKAVLLHMRKQRLGLIQTPEQLRFSYMTVLNAAHHVLDLVPSISDINQEIHSFTEAVIATEEERELKIAEQKRRMKKSACVSPPPEKASALRLPPQLSSCVPHCSSAPASRDCFLAPPQRLHRPPASILTLAPLSPTPPPALTLRTRTAPPTQSPLSPIPQPTQSPLSPIPQPTQSPLSPICQPTQSPLSPIPQPTQSPLSPIPQPTQSPLSPICQPTQSPSSTTSTLTLSEASLPTSPPPPSAPRSISSPLPPSSPPSLLGSQFSTSHPLVGESECESVVKTKKQRSWFKRLKQRLIQSVGKKRTRE